MAERPTSPTEVLDLMRDAHPSTVRGRFHRLDPPGVAVEARFAYKAPSSWLVEASDRTEISNENATVIFDAGEATALPAGSVIVNSLLHSMVQPSRFVFEDLESRLEKELDDDSHSDRPTWVVHLKQEGAKPRTSIAVDAETGIVLAMKAGRSLTELRDVEIDVALEDDLFQYFPQFEELSEEEPH